MLLIKLIDQHPAGIKLLSLNKSIKLRKYEDFRFLSFPLTIIFAVINTKKGLINSMGCKRKKNKSSHLFAPLISTPIIGTNINNTNEITKVGIINFFKKDFFI